MGKELHVGVSEANVDNLCTRLSEIEGLYFPSSFAMQAPRVSSLDKKEHLSGLLRRDAALFLERYGLELTGQELESFSSVGSDYEVAWHLKQLRARLEPTAADRKHEEAKVKNRRLAYMTRLLQEGSYFSEEAMRERCPLLHHDLVGRFQDASQRMAARPGERMAEVLMRQTEEAIIEMRVREGRRARGESIGDVREEEEIEEEEEEEDEEEEEESKEGQDNEQSQKEGNQARGAELHGAIQVAQNVSSGSEGDIMRGGAERLSMSAAAQASTSHPFTSSVLQEHVRDEITRGASAPSATSTSLQEQNAQDGLREFQNLMEERFLSGQDVEHVDYNAIDHNALLDDDWLDEVSRDAEDRYFEED